MTPVVFGEVLFDHFPDGSKVLGGAPFNVAWHLRGFGLEPLFISRVGSDADGDEVIDRMQRWGMRTDGVQRDPTLPTGRVDVTLIEGEPHYTILHPAAWDHIAPCNVSVDAAVLYHGSLALRSPHSRHSLDALRRQQPVPRFVDVNLRDPWWEPEGVGQDVRQACTVKLNASELSQLADASADAFRTRMGITHLVLTRGEHGAELLTDDGTHTIQPEPADAIIDTVGAGDAFASVVLLGQLRGWSPTDTLQRAQDFASLVVQHRGATRLDPTPYTDLQHRWNVPVAP